MSAIALCQGTALALPLKDASVHCVVTSPPYYGLRDYGVAGQLGMETTPEAYVTSLVQAFREVRRVLRPEGTLWLNIGDSYNAAGRAGHGTRIGYKQGTNRASATGQDACRPQSTLLGEKQLLGMPWRLALALQADGWVLRSEIIWAKPNPMPESVTDRPTRAHEQVFLFSKQPHYFYDAQACREVGGNGWHGSSFMSGHDLATKPNLGQQVRQETPGRNMRTVWSIATEPTPFAHFACMPTALVRRCLLAGAPHGGVVFDPFCGSGTTLFVARELGHYAIGIDLSYPYLRDIARTRLGLEALDAWQHGQQERPIHYDDLPLFGG